MVNDTTMEMENVIGFCGNPCEAILVFTLTVSAMAVLINDLQCMS